MTTTIACISDLHGLLPASTPECDVLIVAGDICPYTNHTLALTSGIGEQSYAEEEKYELEDGERDQFGFHIYGADHQTLASVAPIHEPEGYDREIATVICNAGKAISKLGAQ